MMRNGGFQGVCTIANVPGCLYNCQPPCAIASLSSTPTPNEKEQRGEENGGACECAIPFAVPEQLHG